jgi:AraC-like DNA-binding protein
MRTIDLAAFALATSVAAQTKHVVGPGGFATIDAAITAASPGDFVLVQPGSYAGFRATKSVTIRAASLGTVFVTAGSLVTASVVFVHLLDLDLKFLSVDGCTCTLYRCRVTATQGLNGPGLAASNARVHLSRRDWAQVGLRAGYYDQAHLCGEFREFTGSTPTRCTLPDKHHPDYLPLPARSHPDGAPPKTDAGDAMHAEVTAAERHPPAALGLPTRADPRERPSGAWWTCSNGERRSSSRVQATATASVASATRPGAKTSRPATIKRPIMAATASLRADPRPVTQRLTRAGENWWTPAPARADSASTTPRASPSRSAAWTLLP